MASESLRVTRRALEAFNDAGANIDAASDPPPGIYADELELVPLRGALEGTVYTGASAWRQFWDESRESWSEVRLDLERMEPVGSGVLAVGRLSGTGRGTGASVEAQVAFAVHVRDGLITRNAVHLAEADARHELEAD